MQEISCNIPNQPQSAESTYPQETGQSPINNTTPNMDVQIL